MIVKECTYLLIAKESRHILNADMDYVEYVILLYRAKNQYYRINLYHSIMDRKKTSLKHIIPTIKNSLTNVNWQVLYVYQ